MIHIVDWMPPLPPVHFMEYPFTGGGILHLPERLAKQEVVIHRPEIPSGVLMTEFFFDEKEKLFGFKVRPYWQWREEEEQRLLDELEETMRGQYVWADRPIGAVAHDFNTVAAVNPSAFTITDVDVLSRQLAVKWSAARGDLDLWIDSLVQTPFMETKK